jgi:poly-gamma-glutamate synthesis protein (capsule biosynthesis protein)
MRSLSGLFLLLCFLFCGCAKQHQALSIFFTGDLLLDRGVRLQIEKKDAESLFNDVAPLFKQADYTVANLECPVTKIEAPINKKYIFRGEPEWLNAIKQAGITHLILANNHSNDQGRSGMVDTYNNLLDAHLTPVGYGLNQTAACLPVVLEKNGIKAAVFSTVTLALENFAYLPDSIGVCQAQPKQLAAAVANYKKQHPGEYIIVVLHWGIEFDKKPAVYQRIAAHALIDSGADVIIGHHPHVVQTHTTYKGKHIFYSLGNFVFDQKEPGNEGLMVKLNIERQGIEVTEIPILITKCTPTPK